MKKIINVLLILVFVCCVLTACVSSHDVGGTPDNGSGSVETNDPSSSIDEPNGESTEGGSSDTVPPKDEKKVIRFTATGDVLIHDAIHREAKTLASKQTGYNKTYYFDSMYENIASFVKQADVAFVNHECPIAGNSYGIDGYPLFNAPEESGQALIDLGFNVINISNNHMLDMDHKCQGYKNTIEYWKNKDVLQIGGYESRTDYDTPRILEVEGIKIAFLSYTYDMLNYDPSKDALKQGTALNKNSAGYIVPIINDADITKHIASAREKADLVFVSMHWGTENTFTPTKEQKRLAKLIADCGADAIIGHHSHTVQPVEWIEGKNGNKTLCVYSLGNLISGMLNTKNMVGGFISFDIIKENGKARIENPVFTPTVCHYDANNSKKDPEGNPTRTNFKVYLMKDYTEALAKSHGLKYKGAINLSTFKKFVTDTISKEFLPDYLK